MSPNKKPVSSSGHASQKLLLNVSAKLRPSCRGGGGGAPGKSPGVRSELPPRKAPIRSECPALRWLGDIWQTPKRPVAATTSDLCKHLEGPEG